ncbi:hypothetical protein [Sphingorhabdus sp. 109]|jgi:hypothetical protein|uniref:hypothetical protein n=1 Tax=Sphingorhabdus sp. 109 TaxID=2653173 RepID=UPI0012F12691|nr:hypothetical protein [Sphingorhabdus sp. 109]VWX57739.1 conserved exported hypothetical protein [Sphingorhabdus sp. 109]
MKVRVLFLATALLMASSATNANDRLKNVPIPERSESAIGFVPDGWYIEKSVVGDLNKDGLADLAIIIRQNDPSLIIESDGFGRDTYDCNPRTILVLLKESGGGYLQIARNDQIIPVPGSATMDDPIDKASDGSLTIKNGVLRLNIHFWSSAGTWFMFNRTFSFRMQGGQLVLIGYDNYHVHRGSGELKTVSINYLTRRMKTENGSIEDEHVPEMWSKIRRKPLIPFASIGDGYDFDPDDY